MTIAQFAHRLTRPHLSFMPDGKAGQVPSLIQELREAINHSTSGGNGSSDGQPLPFDTKALELLKFFEQDAGEHHRHRYGTIHRGTLETLIQKIADDQQHPTTPDDWETFFEHWMSDWCDLIDDMLRPTKVRTLDSTPCPACNQTTHGKERETCLAIHCYIPGQGRDLKPIEAWTAECRACGATWSGDTMKYLLASIAA